MKDEIVNEIVCMLQRQGFEVEGISNKIYMILKDVDIVRKETALAVRDDILNDNLLKRFLAAKMVKGCTENTIIAYKNTISSTLCKLNKSVTEITSDDIRVYIAYRLTQDKISKSFMNTELRYLRTLFSFLKSEDLISKNPMEKIEVIKAPKEKKKSFSDLECEKIRAACSTAMETAIVEVLLSTGCRVSELCKMRIDEIDGDKIIVHGKGNKDRTVYFNAKAQIALENYLAERSDTNPYIFPPGFFSTKIGSKKLKAQCSSKNWYKNPKLVSDGMRDKGSIEATVRKLGRDAAVDDVHPHRFRRTCATLALRRGMPIELVSKMLGHEQLTTTQIYLDLTENDLENAHKKYVV